MLRRRSALATALAVTIALPGLGSLPAAAGPGHGQRDRGSYTFAVTGDLPYGDAQVATSPRRWPRSTPIAMSPW